MLFRSLKEQKIFGQDAIAWMIRKIIWNTPKGQDRGAKAEELLKNNPEIEEKSRNYLKEIIDENMKEVNGPNTSFQSFIKSQREGNSGQMLQK